jgi:hypothetical protein
MLISDIGKEFLLAVDEFCFGYGVLVWQVEAALGLTKNIHER